MQMSDESRAPLKVLFAGLMVGLGTIVVLALLWMLALFLFSRSLGSDCSAVDPRITKYDTNTKAQALVGRERAEVVQLLGPGYESEGPGGSTLTYPITHPKCLQGRALALTFGGDKVVGASIAAE